MKKYREIQGDGGSGIVAQVTEKLSALNSRMKNVRHKIAVMSGKGGVGKSTVSVGLAASMARMGHKVGILDADLNGPSIPKLMGIDDAASLKTGAGGVVPPTGAYGIKIMSTELFMSSHGQPINWDGPSSTYSWLSVMEATALRELIADTEWGNLDFLFIDLPPVIARLRDLTQLLGGLDGVILVTIPSGISNRIVVKSINSVKELGVPIIGVVENMKGYACAHCGKENSPYETVENMTESFEWLGVPYLGSVPFNKNLQELSSKGLSEGGAGEAALQSVFGEINKKVFGFLGESPGRTL
jgi:ATP-binding protein involved in chromosome partitioning